MAVAHLYSTVCRNRNSNWTKTLFSRSKPLYTCRTVKEKTRKIGIFYSRNSETEKRHWHLFCVCVRERVLTQPGGMKRTWIETDRRKRNQSTNALTVERRNKRNLSLSIFVCGQRQNKKNAHTDELRREREMYEKWPPLQPPPPRPGFVSSSSSVCVSLSLYN